MPAKVKKRKKRAKAGATGALACGVELHRTGRLGDARVKYLQVLQAEPGNADAIHLMGLLEHQQGRHAEAVGLIGSAIRKDPGQAIYHNNLGAALRDSGREDEAARAFARAVSLEPGYAGALSNLGSTLMELGRFTEAIGHLAGAVGLDPGDASAHYCLGNAFREAGRMQEAEASYRRAVALRPGFTEALHNLGNILRDQGRLAEGLAECLKALASSPASSMVYENVLFLLFALGQHDTIVATVRDDHLSGRVGSLDRGGGLIIKAIVEYLRGQVVAAYQSSCLASGITWSPGEDRFRENLKAYLKYMGNLLEYRKANPGMYAGPFERELFVVGESHCLSPAHTLVRYKGIVHKVVPRLVIGCKAFHLAVARRKNFRAAFTLALDSLGRGDTAVFSVGEIDCRLREGILPHHRKRPGGDLDASVDRLVGQYVKYVLGECATRGIVPVFQGVPAPNSNLKGVQGDLARDQARVVRLFNEALGRSAKAGGAETLDLYAGTAAEGGRADGTQHIDEHHLKPHVFKQAIEAL